MPDELAIWLNDLHVASVERERQGRLRLTYTRDARDTFDGGTPLLSINLPLTGDRYPNQRTRAFLDGLLPEGDPRNAIAAELELPSSDIFGLISELGRDCAGALVIQDAGAAPPPPGSTSAAEPLVESDLDELVANLGDAPLGVDRSVRLSLAGVQQKLLLTRLPDGRWGRPAAGAPSTHILKPQIAALEHTVENEAFCMTVARNLGLPAATVETLRVGGRDVLAVERYDRRVASDGSITRIHQEDACQALGLAPSQKYEQKGGPTLRRIAGVLEGYADAVSIDRFLEAATLNVALGNCDAHGKNFSLLHAASGRVELAPLYDLLCTRVYDGLDPTLAMYVDSVRKADDVTVARLVAEAVTWGVRREHAQDVVDGTVTNLPKAISAAASDRPDTPSDLIAFVESRVARLAIA